MGDLSDECVALVGFLISPLINITQVRTLYIHGETCLKLMQWESGLNTFSVKQCPHARLSNPGLWHVLITTMNKEKLCLC